MDNMRKAEKNFNNIHGGGGGGRWRGRGGWGGYYGYPYPYYDYPYQEVVLVDTTASPIAVAAAKVKEEAKKKEDAAPEKASADKGIAPNALLNYGVGGVAGAIAGYFIAQSQGRNAIGGGVIGAAVVVGGMMAINQLSSK